MKGKRRKCPVVLAFFIVCNKNFIIFRPDEGDENNVQQTSQPNCRHCAKLKLEETKFSADIAEFQQKCQLLRTENAHLRAEVQKNTTKALRLGQILCTKRCKFCSILVAKSQFSEHLCGGLTEIKCEYCVNETFASTMALSEHLSSGVHTTMKFYKCAKCTLGIPMHALLQIHENSIYAHLTNEVPTDTSEYMKGKKPSLNYKWIFFFEISVYKCSKCNESSKYPLELVRHFENSHPYVSEPPKRLPSFECSICGCQLDNRADIRNHLKQHVTVRDIKCEICRELLTLNEMMQWHICGCDDGTTENRELSCEYCDQSFQSVAKCVEHLKTMHADDRTIYQCRKCSQYFGMMQLRDLHEKYYPHVSKPFQCNICSHKFSSTVRIQTHMQNVHSGKN